MRFLIKPLSLLVSFVILGCSPGSNDFDYKFEIENTESKSFTSYKEHQFEDDLLGENIRSLKSDIDILYKDHAEKNNYPGYAYGIITEKGMVISGSGGKANLGSAQEITNSSGFHIASMTKSFTAMAILKLRDEGKLALHDQVSEYITELKDQLYLTNDSPPITIWNLMTMTSGLPEDNPWADRQLERKDAEFIKFLKAGIQFSNVPSIKYEYSNLGFAMLGTIISRVSKMPYQEFITKEILKPLGMKNTYWEYEKVPEEQLAQGYRWEDKEWKEEPMLHTGAFGAIGGLITSMEDFSKYVVYHLTAWPPRNTEETGPVKRSTLREMHMPVASRLYPKSKNSIGEACPRMVGYGMGLSIQTDCANIRRISHSGGLPGFGSEFRIYPEYGVAVISFSNRTYASTGAINSKVIDLLFSREFMKPRVLPASKLVRERASQIIRFIESWDDAIGKQLFAENFYLDSSKSQRKAEMDELLKKTGRIVSIEKVQSLNQLRGIFTMHGENDDIHAFFSLSPERIPKVQALYFWME